MWGGVRRDASRNSIAPAVTAPASREPERDRRQADEASRQTPSEQSRVQNARAAQSQLRVIETVVRAALFDNPDAVRSEEHTSELQSLMRISYAVFCLKKQHQNTDTTIQ